MDPKKNDLIEITKRRTVEEWARIAILEFQKSIEKKKIGVSRRLFNSFKKELQANGGDVQAVMIKFAMYGRYRDMGVGRGMKAYERKTNKSNLIAARRYGANVGYSRRMPKRWYSKTKMAQTLRLQEILIRDIGEDINRWIGSSFQGEVSVRV